MSIVQSESVFNVLQSILITILSSQFLHLSASLVDTDTKLYSSTVFLVPNQEVKKHISVIIYYKICKISYQTEQE